MDKKIRDATYDKEAELKEDDAVKARAEEIAGMLMGELDKHPDRYEKHDKEFWTAFYVANYSDQIKLQLKNEGVQKEQAQDQRDARREERIDQLLDAPAKFEELLTKLDKEIEKLARGFIAGKLGGSELSLRGPKAGQHPPRAKYLHGEKHKAAYNAAVRSEHDEAHKENEKERSHAPRLTRGDSKG